MSAYTPARCMTSYTVEDLMVKGPTSIVRPIKDKIRMAAKKNRIRLSDFFSCFDRMNTKRVTVSQFLRAMTMTGIPLSKNELDMLAIRYEVPAADQVNSAYKEVNYQKLCVQIDKVFAVHGLERDPKKSTALALADVGEPVLGPENPNITAVEAEELRDILNQFNVHCGTRGYNVKILFGDFDRNNDGQITKNQFMRNVFVLCPNLTMDQATLVTKAYESPLGMNYRDLDTHCTDIALPDVEDSSLFGRMKKNASGISIGQQTLDDTMKFFAMKFAQTPGIRMADYFSPFDKRKVGKLPSMEFAQACVRCFGSLTLLQTKALCTKFDCGGGMCDWKEFIRATTQMAGEMPYDRTPGLCQSNVLSEDEADYVHSMLEDICREVTKHRLLLKPTFQDFDRRNEDHVSKEQFMRALSMFNLLPQDKAAVSLLCSAFSPTSYRQSSGTFVNYRKFLDYIHGIVNEQERQQLMMTAAAYKDVPRHLRTDFTPTKADTAPLSPTNFNASPPRPAPFASYEEEEEKKIEFGEEDSVAQDTLDELTNTYDFGSVATNTFTVSEMSKSSLATGRADRPLDVVMADIRRSVLENRIRLNPFFEDHDKLRKGNITRSRFFRGLGASGNRLSEFEVGQLAAEYSTVDDVDGDGVPFVCWKAFVDDINTVFTISGLEMNPNLDVASTIRGIRGNAMNCDEQSVFINDDDNEALAAFLNTFSEEVTKKNIDLFPPFEDFDRFHRGTVTANMFARVLSGLGFYPGDALFEVLVEKFREKEKDSQKDVNYKAFIAILDAIGRGGADPRSVPSALEYKKQLVADTVLPFDASQFVERNMTRDMDSADPGDVSVTLEEIKRQTDYHCVRLVDFMSDGDRLRSGNLTTAKFKNGLARAGVNLMAGELLSLETAFKSTSRADCVDWKMFLEAVENSVVAGKLMPEDTGVDLGELNEILDRITYVVEQRRLNLKPYFQDYDKAHFQQVTQNQFSAVMSTLSIPMSVRERETLFTAFMIKEGRKTTNRVDYKQFMLRVDKTEGKSVADGGLLG